MDELQRITVFRNETRLDQIVIAPGLKSAAIKLFDKINIMKFGIFALMKYHCNEVLPLQKHTISKSETCLVKSLMRD